jgi:dTDP-L-rhamnose 4-epimerase
MLSRQLTAGEVQAEIRCQYRTGDIRHCYADMTRARALLGFEPRVTLEDGLPDLLAWVRHQTAADSFAQAEGALVAKDLMI